MGEMAAKMSNGVKTQAMQISMHSLLRRRGMFGGYQVEGGVGGAGLGDIGGGASSVGDVVGRNSSERVCGLCLCDIGGSSSVSAWSMEAEEGAF